MATDMEPEASDHIITGPEIGAQLQYVKRAIEAASDEERQTALADGLLAFGFRFVRLWSLLIEQAGDPAAFDDLAEETRVLFVSWMKGNDITSRADEPERRALAALQLLDSDVGRDLRHYAARAILQLPESHPMRDVNKVRAAVRAQLADFQARGDDIPWVFAAQALMVAYDEQFGTDDELTAWESWAETVATHLEPGDAERLWGTVEACYVGLALRNGPMWRERAAQARSRVDQTKLSRDDQALSDLRLMVSAVADDDQLQAAEQLKEALDSGTFKPHVERMMAVKEARVRLAHDQWDRVIALLEPRLDQYEQEYITSIRSEARQETGDDFGEACTSLAFARAAVGQWEQAIEDLERGKCARQRYTRALRQTPKAAELLELEADLYAISRGLPLDRATNTAARVEDWLAQGLSPEAQLQEQYRQLIPTLDRSTWRAPRIADIQSGLRDGEAALPLGLSWPGLIAALIVRDRPSCLHTFRRPDVTEAMVAEYLANVSEQSEDGFLIALERGGDDAGPRRALSRLLDFLDEAIGGPVAQVLNEHGIRRLVVIPHRFLRLTPLWALASWVDLEVRMAPDSSSLSGGHHAPAMTPTALVVNNPTLDLPLAATEGAITIGRLNDTGFDVRALTGVEASEDAVVERLQGVGLLHFAGHGHTGFVDGSLSALLVSPEWSRAGMSGPEALITRANETPDTPHLVIDQDEGSPRRKLYYEYAKRGTLFVDAVDDDAAVAGELWRAGDILVRGSLEGCALAFLCACSSGLGAIPALDEATGLPAALDMAGVRSVVSTGWPVADAIALLFADEFYARALPKGGSTVEVLAAVHASATALRTMDRAEAAKRVEDLAARAADATARFRLRSYARRLNAGAARPFEHPFDWGAFFVTGAAVLTLQAR
jgi:CHAT domain-containing protein